MIAALAVAAAGGGVTDLKTTIAVNSADTRDAFERAKSRAPKVGGARAPARECRDGSYSSQTRATEPAGAAGSPSFLSPVQRAPGFCVKRRPASNAARTFLAGTALHGCLKEEEAFHDHDRLAATTLYHDA